MSSIRQILPNYTTEDYERWEGQWEIITGVAYAMSPMANPVHQNISSNLSWLLEQAIRNTNCKNCRVYQPIDYKIDETTILNPDLLIVCGPIVGQYLTFPPKLIVEILSPSTALKDRNTKYDLYQREGVKYYLMIEPTTKSIEIFALGVEGQYAPYHSNKFDLDECEIQVDLEKCFD